MSPGPLHRTAVRLLARRGLALRRHPGARRQAALVANRVDLVLDVGAAGGGFACELRDFGYRGDIVSFEPLAAAYRTLAAASAADDRWRTLNYALGDEDGTPDIHVASNSDSSSLLPLGDRHVAAAPQVSIVGTEQIVVHRLDDVAAELVPEGSRPFLKLDTQGFEKQVLAGGPATLARCVGLQLELSFVPLYDGGVLADEAVTLAYDAGFRLVSIDPGFADPHGQVLQADAVFARV